MNRRCFNRLSLTTLGTSSLGLIACQSARAAGTLKPLNRDHPPAEALRYVDDAANADPSVYPEAGKANCGNCRHYQGGNQPRGACALFSGFSVRSSGWCTGWVAR